MIPGQQEQYIIPRQLDRRPPRPVRRRAGTLGCAIIGARVVALIFLGAGLFLLGRIPVVITVITSGESHPGHIEKTWTSRGSKGSTKYHVQYTYEAGGQIHTASRGISKSQYGRLTPASPPLDVRVTQIAGADFEEALLPGEWKWKPVWLAVLFATIVNGVSGLFVYLLWIIPMQHKRLCSEGKPILGHITRMHSSSGKTTTYYLDYEWDHPGLGPRTATMTVQSDPWHRAQIGEPVTVLCYPNRRRPTVMYEYGDFECA